PVCAQLDQGYKANSAKYGLDYAGLVTVSATAPSYTGECLSLINKDVDAILMSLGAATIERLVRDCGQQGFKGYYGIFSTSVSERSFDKSDGLRALGYFNQFPWYSKAAPVQEYRDVMTAADEDIDIATPAATGT